MGFVEVDEELNFDILCLKCLQGCHSYKSMKHLDIWDFFASDRRDCVHISRNGHN